MSSFQDYKVKDLNLAELGRREIQQAEFEMPALMHLREKYRDSKPLLGAKILGSLHMTVQTAVLIETLCALGASVRWCSCNIFSTQDQAAAAIAATKVPVYAWKNETEEEYWWCLDQVIAPNGELADTNLLLDDGGDLTNRIIEKYPQLCDKLHGVSEETTTGVHILHKLFKAENLPFPAIDVNASITKGKNDNRYGCRHSLNDAIKRGTDMLLSGLKGMVIGYGDVGKGSAASLRQEMMIVKVSEVDPICAMQACMDGYEVASPFIGGNPKAGVDKQLLSTIDVLVTATGNLNVCNSDMLDALKTGAVVCNIGHFDSEIDIAYLHKQYEWEQIKPQVHKVWRNKSKNDFIIVLSEGRLVNLGNATGHPSRVMDGSFANQVLAQMRLYEEKFADITDLQRKKAMLGVKVMPRKLDEQVAEMMLNGFSAQLTKMTAEQYEYIGLEEGGVHKPPGYLY